MFSRAPLTELLESLHAAGLEASLDPADLNLPGVWVALDGIATATVGGDLDLQVSLYLIHGDTDYERAMDGLAELFNLATTVVDPDGLVVPLGVVMPNDPTPLPALRLPLILNS